MFEIAPHGKTVIATLPYEERRAIAQVSKEEARQAVKRLKALIVRHAEPGDDEADPRKSIDVARQGDAILLTSTYIPRVAEDGKTCSIYLSLASADVLANQISAACISPEVRKRTRSAPGAQVRVRKRVKA